MTIYPRSYVVLDHGGISYKTEMKLNRKGIHTIGELAQYPLKYVKQSFGVIGEELVRP